MVLRLINLVEFSDGVVQREM